MKKAIIILTVFLFTEILNADDAQLPAGELSKLKGKVEFRTTPEEEWQPATISTKLQEGSQLRTDENSEAILTFDREGATTLNEKTSLEIKQYQKKGETTTICLDVKKGKIWSVVGKLKTTESRFKVETFTAIAGVRGTIFMVALKENSTRIAVLKGEVGVQGRGEEPGYVLLKEKMATTVVFNEKPTPPKLLELREAAEWERWKTSIPFSYIGPIGSMTEGHAEMAKKASKLVRESGLKRRGGRKTEEDFQVLKGALIQLYLDTVHYPSRKQGLQALLLNPGIPDWKGPYLAPGSNLLDPYGRPYQYRIKKTPGGNLYLELKSSGLDRADPNDDHIENIFLRELLQGKK